MSEYIVDVPDEPAKVVRDGWSVRVEYQYKQREEIVRCRDCEHFSTNIHGSYCKKSITTLSNPDGFCAWGERRVDE